MREKLKTLPLAQLKELAKSQGIKGISAMRKAEIIELLCQAARGKSPGEAPGGKDGGNAASGGKAGRAPAQETKAAEPRAQEMRPAEHRFPESRSEEHRSQESRPQRQGMRAARGRGTDMRRGPGKPHEKYSQQRTVNSKPHGTNGSPAPAYGGQTSGESGETRPFKTEAKNDGIGLTSQDLAELDSGIEANGILEVMPDGFWVHTV